jgi:hypothetical protein
MKAFARALVFTVGLLLLTQFGHWGIFAALPTGHLGGRLLFFDDSPVEVQDSGLAYNYRYLSFPIVLPPATGWTFVNAPCSLDSNQGYATLTCLNTGINNLSLVERDLPASGAWTATFAFTGIGTDYPCAFLRNSSTGAIVQFGATFVNKWNSATSYNSQYATGTINGYGGAMGAITWMRVIDDATNRTFWRSADGHHWMRVHGVGRTDFTTPNKIGWGTYTNGTTFGAAGTYYVYANLMSYSLTQP